MLYDVFVNDSFEAEGKTEQVRLGAVKQRKIGGFAMHTCVIIVRRTVFMMMIKHFMW